MQYYCAGIRSGMMGSIYRYAVRNPSHIEWGGRWTM